MRKTSLDISESDHRRANIASAAMGLSAGEFYRCCIKAGLDAMAQTDPKMKAAFELSTDDSRMVLAGRLGGLVETR
jgi:hypothetical protein